MGWKLNYRTTDEFVSLVSPLSKFVKNTVTDENRYVVYLELMKK